MPPVAALASTSVRTSIGPSATFDGTMADTDVAEDRSGTGWVAKVVTGGVVSWKNTSPPEFVPSRFDASSRFVPVIVTTAPADEHVGVNEVMVGAQAPAAPPAPPVDRNVPPAVKVPLGCVSLTV